MHCDFTWNLYQVKSSLYFKPLFLYFPLPLFFSIFLGVQGIHQNSKSMVTETKL